MSLAPVLGVWFLLVPVVGVVVFDFRSRPHWVAGHEQTRGRREVEEIDDEDEGGPQKGQYPKIPGQTQRRSPGCTPAGGGL